MALRKGTKAGFTKMHRGGGGKKKAATRVPQNKRVRRTRGGY